MIAVFAEIDALPCAQIEAPAGDGNGEADSTDGRLGMGGHVVGPLQRVLVFRTVGGHQTVEDGLHIGAHVGVAVLIDAQSTAGVLDEDVDDARLGQPGQLAHYLVGDKMKATGAWSEGDFCLLNHALYY